MISTLTLSLVDEETFQNQYVGYASLRLDMAHNWSWQQRSNPYQAHDADGSSGGYGGGYGGPGSASGSPGGGYGPGRRMVRMAMSKAS